MKNVKAIVLNAAVLLGGASLILGNGVLASCAMAADNQTQRPVIVSEETSVSAMQLSNIAMYNNSGGETYMGLINGGEFEPGETSKADSTDGKIKASAHLSEEEARQIGIKAISEKFGLEEEDIKAFDVKAIIRHSSPRTSMTVSQESLFTEEDRGASAENDLLIWSVTLTPVNQEDYPALDHYRALFDDPATELMNVHAFPLIKEGTPLASELTADKAQEISIAALTEKYALTQKTLDKFTVSLKYFEITDEAPGKHTWWVNLYPTNTGEFSEIGCYWTYIDAATGDVLQLNSAVDGKG